MSIRIRTVELLILAVMSPAALAQPPANSPRRTWQVDVIERVGGSVLAVFSEGQEHQVHAGSGSIIHESGRSQMLLR